MEIAFAPSSWALHYTQIHSPLLHSRSAKSGACNHLHQYGCVIIVCPAYTCIPIRLYALPLSIDSYLSASPKKVLTQLICTLPAQKSCMPASIKPALKAIATHPIMTACDMLFSDQNFLRSSRQARAGRHRLAVLSSSAPTLHANLRSLGPDFADDKSLSNAYSMPAVCRVDSLGLGCLAKERTKFKAAQMSVHKNASKCTYEQRTGCSGRLSPAQPCRKSVAVVAF